MKEILKKPEKKYTKLVNLKNHTTFGLNAIAKFFYPLISEDDIEEIVNFSQKLKIPLIPLGSGSNVIFGDYINAVIMPVLIKNVSIKPQNEKVLITLGAGCNWHETVKWTIEQGYFGLENLSLIPGTVGAAPVQNIGAYGVEISDRLYSVTAYCLIKRQIIVLTKKDCALKYRSSIFKESAKNKFIILYVTLSLDRTFKPVLTYPAIKKALDEHCNTEKPTAIQISDIIINIRRSKLPDPSKLGNVGSFFKNPIVDNKILKKLQQQYPFITSFITNNNNYKISAGMLIQECGLKGYRNKENVGVYEKQALVLVNHGGATGKDIIKLSDIIKKRVFDKFNIKLEIEPTLYLN